MLLTVLLVLGVLFLLGGGWYQSRPAPPPPDTRAPAWYGWSPLGIILVLLLVLYLTGHLTNGGLR